MFAGRLGLTHQTAATAEWFAVPARTALAVCAKTRSRRTEIVVEGFSQAPPQFGVVFTKYAAGHARSAGLTITIRFPLILHDARY